MFTRLQLATMVEDISLVKDDRTLVNQSIQVALDRVYQAYDFPYYIQDKGVVNTIATYTVGTVDATNGSKTITGHSTVFTSSMEGRKIRVGNQNAYYRIKTVNSPTSLTLEQPFQDTSVTLTAYTIYQDEYRLNPDIDKYKTLRQAENSVVLFSYHPTRFDEKYPMPNSFADPIYEIMEGTLLDTYSTGTVSGTANTSILTGAGTAWTGVSGLGRLSKITVGTGTSSQVLTVKSVDSDTQITVYDTLSANIASSTTYFITLNNLRVQLYQIPDSARILYYRYFRQPTPLMNDWDIPDMPHAFHWILVYGSLSIMLMQKGDINKAQQEAEARFIAGINQMIAKIGSFTPDRIYTRKSQDRIRNTRSFTDGLENSNFDRRWSQPSGI